jgi:hypothetical protein
MGVAASGSAGSKTGAERMVITHLLGGLGNQLIKYSAGRRLAHVRSAELKLEISGVAGHDYTTFRYYELAPANVLQTLATEEDITKFMQYIGVLRIVV